MASKLTSLLITSTLFPTPLLAQDALELSFGATATSDYIFRGETQSDGNPAIQGYFEGQTGLFYGGIWASTVDFGDEDQIELDFYAGLRSDFGPVAVDLNYTRYVYDDSGDCCGEFILDLGTEFTESAGAGLNVAWDPEFGTSWTEISGTLGFLDVWEASAVLGSDFGTLEDEDGDRMAWNAGVTYSFTENFWLDGRYYDANFTNPTGVVSAGFDF